MSVEAAVLIKGLLTGAAMNVVSSGIPVKGMTIEFVPNGDATPDDYGDLKLVFEDGVTMTVKFEIEKTGVLCEFCSLPLVKEDIGGLEMWVADRRFVADMEDLDICPARNAPGQIENLHLHVPILYNYQEDKA